MRLFWAKLLGLSETTNHPLYSLLSKKNNTLQLSIGGYFYKKTIPLLVLSYHKILAGEEGFEPPSTVLETATLPLNYSPSKSKLCYTRLHCKQQNYTYKHLKCQ